MKKNNASPTLVHAVITAGGTGNRAGFSQNKIFELIGGISVIERTVKIFDSAKRVDDITVVYHDGELDKLKEILTDVSKPLRFVKGGDTRFHSVKNALDIIDDGVVLIHDGARPYLDQKDLGACIKSVLVDGSAVLTTPLVNTIVESDGQNNVISSSRKNLYSAVTPQCFKTCEIKRAYALAENGENFTDDAGVYCSFIGKAKLVKGNPSNVKLTFKEDFENALVKGENLPNIDTPTRVGVGFDLHRLVENRKLVLGGIEIPHDKGLLGHSDADVLTHAIMDALLSSASLRDIGYYFSDKDAKYKDISSMILLEEVVKMLSQNKVKPLFISAVIMAEKPKLSKFVPLMKENLARAIGVDEDKLSISLTTLEGIGVVGREEGIACRVSVLSKDV